MEPWMQLATCKPNVTWLSAVSLSALGFSLAASHFREESRFSLEVEACPLSCRTNRLSPWKTDHATSKEQAGMGTSNHRF